MELQPNLTIELIYRIVGKGLIALVYSFLDDARKRIRILPHYAIHLMDFASPKR
jgi:hypothetical protein